MSSRPEGQRHSPEKEQDGRLLIIQQQESTRAALALLLGPETDYHIRIRATRRLARQGSAILSLFLATLNSHPEITSPPWPWWPPQYENCSRLLLYLAQKAETPLEDLLRHPSVIQPVGPVLWISLIEATGLLPHENHEPLLCLGLTLPWLTVRYAAAMALVNRAGRTALQPSTLLALHLSQNEHEELSVRLTASYALLISGEESGLDTLIQILHTSTSQEARKAAVFLLATRLPIPLSIDQRTRLTTYLLPLLQEEEAELASYAAQALSKIALPSVLPALSTLLASEQEHSQLMALTVLEEIAQHGSMRRAICQRAIPTSILPLLRATAPDVRRQACYTLAACGGEYAAAVLGTIVLNQEHPSHLEAIESLRTLQDSLRKPIRIKVVDWLLKLLPQAQEEEQICVLDTLISLLWQTYTRRQKHVWQTISQAIISDEHVIPLLNAPSALVRQRSVDLLRMLREQIATRYDLQKQLLHMLHTDSDSGVRACVAYTCEQLVARWAIPDLLLALLDTDMHVARTALNALSQLATCDDSIVVYTLQELTYATPGEALSQAARAILKKWRSFPGKNSDQKKLHNAV